MESVQLTSLGTVNRKSMGIQYLKNDPMSLYCSHIQSVFGHNLLPLSQGHIMDFPIVYGEAKLLT